METILNNLGLPLNLLNGMKDEVFDMLLFINKQLPFNSFVPTKYVIDNWKKEYHSNNICLNALEYFSQFWLKNNVISSTVPNNIISPTVPNNVNIQTIDLVSNNKLLSNKKKKEEREKYKNPLYFFGTTKVKHIAGCLETQKMIIFDLSLPPFSFQEFTTIFGGDSQNSDFLNFVDHFSADKKVNSLNIFTVIEKDIPPYIKTFFALFFEKKKLRILTQRWCKFLLNIRIQYNNLEKKQTFTFKTLEKNEEIIKKNIELIKKEDKMHWCSRDEKNQRKKKFFLFSHIMDLINFYQHKSK